MTDAAHFRKLEAMYRAAPCNRHFESILQVGDGTAEIEMAVKEAFLHAAGAIHGSVYFKAMDDAAYFAAQSQLEGVFLLTANFQLHFLRPISHGSLRAVGTVTGRTRSQFLADAALYDDQGRLAARGGGSFMRSAIKLTPDVGYR